MEAEFGTVRLLQEERCAFHANSFKMVINRLGAQEAEKLSFRREPRNREALTIQ